MRYRASTDCRRSYGTVSPIQASESGMSAPAVAPARNRVIHERGKRRRERACKRRQRTARRRERDDAIFAVAIPDWTVRQLQQTVGNRKGRHGLRHCAETHAVLRGEIRE